MASSAIDLLDDRCRQVVRDVCGFEDMPDTASSPLYALFSAFDSLFLVDQKLYSSPKAETRKGGYILWDRQKCYEEAFTLLANGVADKFGHDISHSPCQASIDYFGGLILQLADFVRLDSYRQMVKYGEFNLAYQASADRFLLTIPEESDSKLPSVAMAEASFYIKGDLLVQKWRDRAFGAWSDPEDYQFINDGGRLKAIDARRFGRLEDPDSLLEAHPMDVQMVDPNDRIEGVSIHEYSMVMHSLERWSYFALMAYYEGAKQGVEQSEIMPVQIVDRQLLIRDLRRMSGVSINKVRTVLSWISWHECGGVGDVFLHPIVQKNDTMMWSCRVILKSNVRRNLLKRLNLSPIHSDAVSSIIGGRSSLMASTILDMLQQYGYVGYVESKYKGSGLEGDIDLLCWHPDSPSEVMVCECKAHLPPDSPQEIIRISSERADREVQIDRSIEYLYRTDISLLQNRFAEINWSQVGNYYGFYVTMQGTTYSRGKRYKHPTFSYVMLRDMVKKEHIASPSVFSDSASTWAWVPERDMSPGACSMLSTHGINMAVPIWTGRIESS